MWKVGQEVWDVSLGKGTIIDYIPNGRELPVVARFFVDIGETYTREYTEDGRWKKSWNRTLFFSEPKVEALTFPPFKPTIKNGEKLVAVDRDDEEVMFRVIVSEETENYIIARNVATAESMTLNKEHYFCYRVGEPIY